MKYITLNLSDTDYCNLKSNSVLRNFPEYKNFHFSIPMKLSFNDQKYLIEQGYSFFKAQFVIEIGENIVFFNKKEDFKQSSNSKELSWEIFFRYNQFIKICQGVYDETLDWFLSGFIGKIIDFYSDNNKNIFLIELSANSLSIIPESHLRSILESDSFFFTYLSSDLLMPVQNLENQAVLEENLLELFKEVLGNQDSIIFEESTSIIQLIHKWEFVFKETITRPIISKTYSYNNEILQLIDIPYSERKFGVWGTFSDHENVIDLPLIDISEISGNNTFSQLLQEYKKQITPLLPN